MKPRDIKSNGVYSDGRTVRVVLERSDPWGETVFISSKNWFRDTDNVDLIAFAYWARYEISGRLTVEEE
jgi:hypothetical protein